MSYSVDYWSNIGRERFGSIERVIIHSMGEFIEGGDRDYFAPDYLTLVGFSAHAFVTPSGVEIRQRRDNQIAYHAGRHNENSLGIEFLVPGVHTWATFINAIQEDYITPAAFDKGVEVVAGWVRSFGPLDIVRHSTIDPKRKKDPGEGFPFENFLREIEGLFNA